MKKLLILFISILLFVSCTKDSEQKPNSAQTTNNPTIKQYNIQDYYPFKENVKMKFSGNGNEFASQETYVDFIKENRMQLRINNGGTTMVQVLENKDGELRKIFSKEEYYYRQNYTTSENGTPDILLKEPLVKGTSWQLPDGRKRLISEINVDISTLSGNYKALEVTTESADATILEYYVLNIGKVKTIFKTKNTEVITSLDKVENNGKFIQTIKFFYPNFLNGTIVYIKKDIEFSTNDEIKTVFQKQFKEGLNSNITPLLGPTTSVNKIELNSEEHKASIDLSKSFIKELNAGSSYELDAINSLVDSIGTYYNVEKVYISLDGSPYASGHIALKPGEFFKVNIKNAVEYK